MADLRLGVIGISGKWSTEALADGLREVLALDRATVRARAEARFGPDRMVDQHVRIYERLITLTEPEREGPDSVGSNASGIDP